MNQKTRSQQAEIEPGAFKPVDLLTESGDKKGRSLYLSRHANRTVLTEVVEALGLTKYQLAGLLGISSRANLFKYFNGTRRPSPAYLLRLVKLQLLYMAGVPIYLASRIDWDAGTIYWRNGGKPTSNRLIVPDRDHTRREPDRSLTDLP